jgi:hypothetical protein
LRFLDVESQMIETVRGSCCSVLYSLVGGLLGKVNIVVQRLPPFPSANAFSRESL